MPDHGNKECKTPPKQFLSTGQFLEFIGTELKEYLEAKKSKEVVTDDQLMTYMDLNVYEYQLYFSIHRKEQLRTIIDGIGRSSSFQIIPISYLCGEVSTDKKKIIKDVALKNSIALEFKDFDQNVGYMILKGRKWDIEHLIKYIKEKTNHMENFHSNSQYI